MKRQFLIAATVIGLLAGATIIGVSFNRSDDQTKTITQSNESRYLPLGDSYTIGQSIEEAGRWPNQLAERLARDGQMLQIVANPAVTGYTSQDLIDRELPLVDSLKPDFVSLQIGVNDYVQGMPADVFESNLELIITSLQSKLPRPGNILLVTIPDYGKTPAGSNYGDSKISEEAIANLNSIIIKKATKYALPVADIFAVSQNVSSDPSLVANDELHPSASQYSAWTDIIYGALKKSAIKF